MFRAGDEVVYKKDLDGLKENKIEGPRSFLRSNNSK